MVLIVVVVAICRHRRRARPRQYWSWIPCSLISRRMYNGSSEEGRGQTSVSRGLHFSRLFARRIAFVSKVVWFCHQLCSHDRMRALRPEHACNVYFRKHDKCERAH